MSKDLSTWEWKEVNDWLVQNKMEKFISNFQKYNVNGYDLCYLANEDFNEMSINNFHDKNIILKSIRTLTLEELKLRITYENKTVSVQLDFDPSFTVDIFSNELRDIFKIPVKTYLTTGDNEILMPNLKMVELILLNPQKYKNIRILTDRELGSCFLNSSSTGTSIPMTSRTKSQHNFYSNYSLYDKGGYTPTSSNNPTVVKDISNNKKNELERDYLAYKENSISENHSSNIGGGNPNSLYQYKPYTENSSKDFQKSYTPNERRDKKENNISIVNSSSIYTTKNLSNTPTNINTSNLLKKDENTTGTNYLYHSGAITQNSSDLYSTQVPKRSNYPSSSYNYLRDEPYKKEIIYSGTNSSSTTNINQNKNLDLEKNQYVPGYFQYSGNNDNNINQEGTKDYKKIQSEKRSFRINNNNDISDIQMRPIERNEKYGGYTIGSTRTMDQIENNKLQLTNPML